MLRVVQTPLSSEFLCEGVSEGLGHASNWPAKSAVGVKKGMLERGFEERFRLMCDTVRLFTNDFMFISSGKHRDRATYTKYK